MGALRLGVIANGINPAGSTSVGNTIGSTSAGGNVITGAGIGTGCCQFAVSLDGGKTGSASWFGDNKCG